MKILSVASGRCINELQFIDQDYDITCSDLDIPASYELAKKTFKEYKFEVLNILQSHTNEKYNCVLSLGLVYAFSANEFPHKKISNDFAVISSLNLPLRIKL